VKKQKMPRDANERAWLTVQIATGELQPDPAPAKDPVSVELGRKGGLIGGPKRAAKLSAERRSEIAKQAAAVRWGKQ
jgi:hypothetical protein